MENQTILKTMHDFLDYVEGLQGERDLLQVQLSCAEKRLAKLDSEPQEQQQDCPWVSAYDEDNRPMDCEQVVVENSSGKRYMQTYNAETGFVGDIEYWLRLPENV